MYMSDKRDMKAVSVDCNIGNPTGPEEEGHLAKGKAETEGRQISQRFYKGKRYER